jgi:hypothetical protein
MILVCRPSLVPKADQQTRALVTAALAVSALAVNVADISGISFIDTTTKGRLQIVGVEYDPPKP